LDDDAVTSFSDVDNEYYRYVASSEQSNIVEGFEDATFRGNEFVTVEQTIALTARTINQKKGYVYPEQIDKYINFTDDNIISDWAEKEIALAVREGIYSNEMNLKFSDNITRKDAAVILYRLFMIISNTPEPPEITGYDIAGTYYHETVWNKKYAVIAVAAVGVLDITALVLSFLYIKKRRVKIDK
ncbi:MAG: S-layer homology domain-containing protein, partial [Oscillospiraceae bacterium]|nr:S-layer homology domain-containing protein [Oscillospiraceae bacterium]